MKSGSTITSGRRPQEGSHAFPGWGVFSPLMARSTEPSPSPAGGSVGRVRLLAASPRTGPTLEPSATPPGEGWPFFCLAGKSRSYTSRIVERETIIRRRGFDAQIEPVGWLARAASRADGSCSRPHLRSEPASGVEGPRREIALIQYFHVALGTKLEIIPHSLPARRGMTVPARQKRRHWGSRPMRNRGGNSS